MKKALLTLALVAVSVAAFAQGKVTFVNDSNHYFVIGTALAGDAGGGTLSTAANSAIDPFATGALPVSPLPSGKTLYAQLFAVTGNTQSGLILATSYALDATTWGPTAGKMAAKSIAIANVPGGSIASLAVVVSDVVGALGSAYLGGTPGGAAPAGYTGSYYGTSGIFNMTPGSSISYPTITTGGGSTWAAANLVINAVPEPTSFALAGLGAAALLIFRRRK